MKYTDHDRLIKISQKAKQLKQYLEENKVSREDLIETYSLQWLVTTPLYNIGEQVYYLSDKFKKAHSNIQWNMISGLRHRLVHDYEGTNWNIIADIVFQDLPEFINQIDELL